ncbi:MAG: CPBP family intramembrane metalloprotease [Oscillospiraceae bacterium]|nr:CPBP family intramembrane metalloprotease [Oscillospiraceae bacterium]
MIKKPNLFFYTQDKFEEDNLDTDKSVTFVYGYGFVNDIDNYNGKKILKNIFTVFGFGLLFMILLMRVSDQIASYLMRTLNIDLIILRNFDYSKDFKYIFLEIYKIVRYIIYMVPPIFIIYYLFNILGISVSEKNKIPQKLDIRWIFLSIPIVIISSFVISFCVSVFNKVMFFSGISIIEYRVISWGDSIEFFVILILSTVIIPSILEEILFRGLILQFLRRFGDGFALIISSFLFSIIHGNINQSINSFFIGLIIGYFTIRFKTIKIGIIMHMTNNLIYILIMYLDYNLENFSYINFMSIYGILSIVIGIISLFLLMKFNKDFFLDKSQLIKNDSVFSKIKIGFTSITFMLSIIIFISFIFIKVSYIG